MKRLELTGQRFGKWLVLGFHSIQGARKSTYWSCRCDCGTEEAVRGPNLTKGGSLQCKSCAGVERGRKGLYSKSKNARYIYFIRCGDYVKIGAANDVATRLSQIQNANPNKIELIDVLENEDEQMWHEIFAHRHHRGEWFHFPQQKEE